MCWAHGPIYYDAYDVYYFLFFELFLFNDDGQLKCRVYDKGDDFNFDLGNYPFMDSNIPRALAYGIYVSRLIYFASIYTDFDDFSKIHQLFPN